jgi:hypothetical protein
MSLHVAQGLTFRAIAALHADQQQLAAFQTIELHLYGA